MGTNETSKCTGGALIDYTKPIRRHLWVSHVQKRIFVVDGSAVTYGAPISYCPLCGARLEDEDDQ